MKPVKFCNKKYQLKLFNLRTLDEVKLLTKQQKIKNNFLIKKI